MMAAMDTKEAGRRGGVARAKALTPERRVEIAKKAIAARWAKAASSRVNGGKR